MRRKDREVTEPKRLQEIMEQCHVCRIGFYDQGEVYIVPMNFGYEVQNGVYTLYFHSAKAGRKLALVKSCPKVGFEMDTGYELLRADTACGHSARYQSIVGNGILSVVEDTTEQLHGLQLLMAHETGNLHWKFSKEMLSAVTVLRLTVTALSGKEH